MTRLLPALALLPWLALGVAAITRAGSPDPLPAPPAQDALPRAETLAVTWFGQPEQAIVNGWPADLGPFAGLSLAWWGRDSLRGSVLFDARLGVQVRPGVTAQFVAGRLSSAP